MSFCIVLCIAFRLGQVRDWRLRTGVHLIIVGGCFAAPKIIVGVRVQCEWVRGIFGPSLLGFCPPRAIAGVVPGSLEGLPCSPPPVGVTSRPVFKSRAVLLQVGSIVLCLFVFVRSGFRYSDN